MAHRFTAFALLLLASFGSIQAGLIAHSQPQEQAFRYVNGDEHAVAHTHQDVQRSFDGTVAHYAKSVETPYSSVHKQDTRISNNVYQPAIAKSVDYYAAPAPAHSQPAYTPQYHQEQHQPQHYQLEQHQPQPQHYQQHQDHTIYNQAAPAYATPTYPHPSAHSVVHYSPAESVSHMSFEGFGTHFGY